MLNRHVLEGNNNQPHVYYKHLEWLLPNLGRVSQQRWRHGPKTPVTWLVLWGFHPSWQLGDWITKINQQIVTFVVAK